MHRNSLWPQAEEQGECTFAVEGLDRRGREAAAVATPRTSVPSKPGATTMRRLKSEWIHRKLQGLACALLLLGGAGACASRAPEAEAPEQPSGAGDDSPEADAVNEDSASSSS